MPGRRPIDISQFSTDKSNLKSNVAVKNINNVALKSLGLSQFSSTDFQTMLYTATAVLDAPIRYHLPYQ